jgi:rubrerythrin
MDIFEYAMAREKEAEALYRDLAKNCSDTGLAGILTKLADAEVQHSATIETMSKQSLSAPEADSLVGDVRAAFSGLAERRSQIAFETDELALYKKARQFEQDTCAFYTEKAAEADDGDAKQILTELAAQEKLHFKLMDTIVEMVERPEAGNWLENAEWFHGDDY